MKKNFVEQVLEKKVFILIIVALLMTMGMGVYTQLPKQNFPEVVLPVAAVTVVYPGASAEDLEVLVAKKVENAVMALDGFDSCTVDIKQNYVTVMVSLDMNLSQEKVNDSFDDLRLKMNVLKSELPSGVTGLSVSTDVMDTAGMLLSVSSDTVSGDELDQRASELKDTLKRLDGVKRVDIHGSQVSRVEITVNTDKLNALGISLEDVSRLIVAQNSTIPIGNLETHENTIKVSSNGNYESLEDIKNIVVGSSQESGVIYRLSDIALVQKETPKSPKFSYQSTPSILLAVYFDKGINVVNMTDVLRNSVSDFSKHLPQTINIHEIYLQSEVVDKAISGFQKNLVESIVLVMVVVLLSINLRTSLVVSVAIPLSILTTFITLPLFHVNIEFVSLAALIIVLGMLVDNSIVVSESIQTKLDEGLERKTAVIAGTNAVAKSVMVSLVVSCSGFVSLLTLSGAFRQLAYSLPVVIITCLVVCTLVSLLVTPLTSYLFLKPKGKKTGLLFDRIEQTYDRFFQFAFRHQTASLFVAILLLVISAYGLTHIKLETVAKVNKDVITIAVQGDDENDQAKTEAVMKQIEQILKKEPEVDYYFSGVGEGIPRYDYSVIPLGMGNQIGDIFVRVNLSKGSRFRETKEMVAYLQNTLDAEVVGGQFTVDELGIMSFMSKPIEYKIYSDSIEDQNKAAQMIGEQMKTIKGIRNIRTNQNVETYSYEVNTDDKKMNSLGLTKAEVQNELSLALMGRSVSLYREGGKIYPIYLTSDIHAQNRLNNLKIKSSMTGNKYVLSQFSKVALKSEFTQITRIDGRRGKVVSAYNNGQSSNVAIQSELESRVDKLKLPQSVQAEKSGEKKEFFKMLKSIAFAAVFSLVFIFLVLVFQLGEIKKALIAIVSVPFGVMSGIMGLYLCHQNLSFFALLGVLSLLGVVLANAIILIQFIEEERAAGIAVSKACQLASAKRLRAILASTATSVVGLLPLAIGEDLLFVPMARLLMVGLLVAMVINLIYVPIIYDRVYRKNENKKQIIV